MNDLVSQLRELEGVLLLDVAPIEGRLAKALPSDIRAFYEQVGGAILFPGKPYEIRIVSPSELVSANQKFYPDPSDPIWEELQGDISESWVVMAESPELSQYVTIDLDAERLGRVYDSFLETHANPGESPIIARSFTEFVNRQLETGGACWYWTAPGFESPGDAYADAIQ